MADDVTLIIGDIASVASAGVTDATSDGAANPTKVLKTDGSGNLTLDTLQASDVTIGGGARSLVTDQAKLDTIEASADITDTDNVTAAGALMDSELTNEAAVKALDQGVTSTSNPTFQNLTVNYATGNAFIVNGNGFHVGKQIYFSQFGFLDGSLDGVPMLCLDDGIKSNIYGDNASSALVLKTDHPRAKFEINGGHELDVQGIAGVVSLVSNYTLKLEGTNRAAAITDLSDSVATAASGTDAVAIGELQTAVTALQTALNSALATLRSHGLIST